MAAQGLILGVLGGPMCRTWSIRRHSPKVGGGRPVRAREGLAVWGIPGLTAREKQQVEGDSILLLHQPFMLPRQGFLSDFLAGTPC
jgi:hypothetical protein